MGLLSLILPFRAEPLPRVFMVLLNPIELWLYRLPGAYMLPADLLAAFLSISLPFRPNLIFGVFENYEDIWLLVKLLGALLTGDLAFITPLFK